MKFVRSRLFGCALALLACQVGLVAATPIALCRVASPSATAAFAVACTCAHTDAAECPMHKGKTHQPGKSETSRWCVGCGDQVAVILTPLTAGVAILNVSSRTIGPVVTGIALVALTIPLLEVDRPPTAPPPRH